ncbi:MAG: NAD(P)/FAD-dependent oxidoreductase [Alphaproteobacteria bacterium]
MDPIVIAGAGLAGWTVARELRKLDRDVPIVVVAADDGAFYSKPLLSNALALGKAPDAIATASGEAMAARTGVALRARTRIAAIDRGARTLALADGTTLRYARLVLALGADPLRLPIAGDAAGDLMQVNDLGDYARFRAAIEGARRVAILGAGLIGCEFANDLLVSGRDVDVIDLAQRPLGRLLPPCAAEMVRARLAAAGVGWRLGTSVAEASRRDGGGLRLALADGTVLEADAALSAVGLAPRIALARAAGLATGRGIRVDRRLATSDPDVFGLGDCAEIEGMVLPYVMPIMQAARALARTLAGTPTAMSLPPMPVVVKTPAVPVVVAGLPGAPGGWTERVEEDGVAARLEKDGVLHGFALVGAAASPAARNALAGSMASWPA